MAVCEMHYGSPSLGKQAAAMMIVPERKPGPWPVLYLLHGLSDDHSMWTRRTSIERYVEDLPLMVVMPDGGRGFYTDAVEQPKGQYESAITQDLIGFVDRTFHTIATREGRVVAGLSMGGYGALKLALHRPDLFCAAVSHSGAVAWGHQPISDDAGDWRREFRPILGAAPQGGPNDLYALAEQSDRAVLPSLRFDCGTDDFLIADNRAFHQHLEGIGIPHEYVEHPGGHDWGYWDRHIQDSLAFFTHALGGEA